MQYFNYYLEAWKKYAVFDGRASRSEYWYFTLFSVLIWIVLGIISGIVKTNVLGLIYNLAVLIPSLAITARRLHDTDRSGWWILLCLIPLVGPIVLIVFLAQKGQVGSNKYGSAPTLAVANTAPTSTPTPPTYNNPDQSA